MTTLDKTTNDDMEAFHFFKATAAEFGCNAEIDIYSRYVNFTGSPENIKRLMEHLAERLE
jgi:hypothetical protein